MEIRNDIEANGRKYTPASNCAVVICLDGCEPEYLDVAISEGLMPNLFGMNLLDAVYLLENAGLKVEIKGKGHIVNQSIKKGDRFWTNQKISLIASI